MVIQQKSGIHCLQRFRLFYHWRCVWEQVGLTAAGWGIELVLRISWGFCVQKSLKLPSSLPSLSPGGSTVNSFTLPVGGKKKKKRKSSFFCQPSGYSLFQRKEETLLSDHMGHDPLSIKVNRIFVSSEGVGSLKLRQQVLNLQLQRAVNTI